MAVILVGVDSTAAAVLTATARLIAATGDRIVAVHVAHFPAIATVSPLALAGGAIVTANNEIAEHCHLDCELALAGAGITWDFEVRYGDPAAELTRAGDDHDAACIVVGRPGHRRLARRLLGSVTDRLVHHANRPVLVVPPIAP